MKELTESQAAYLSFRDANADFERRCYFDSYSGAKTYAMNAGCCFAYAYAEGYWGRLEALHHQRDLLGCTIR